MNIARTLSVAAFHKIFACKTEIAMTQVMNFSTSPLTKERRCSESEIDVIDCVFRDELVQLAAGSALLQIARLQEVGGMRSVISAAIKCVLEDSDDANDLAPSAVVEKIRQLTDEVEDEILSCKEDRVKHDAIVKAALRRHRPLLLAVAQRGTELALELQHLDRASDAEKRAHLLPGGIPSRHRTLREAGLNDAAIALVEPATESPEQVAAKRADRVAHIKAVQQLLKRFSDDPKHDSGPLAGMDDFAALIAARD